MTSTVSSNTRLVAALLAAGAIGGAGVGAFNAMHTTAAAAISPPAFVAAVPGATPVALPDFSQITERYGPSVVNISVTGTTKVSNDSPLAQNGGPLLVSGCCGSPWAADRPNSGRFPTFLR